MDFEKVAAWAILASGVINKFLTGQAWAKPSIGATAPMITFLPIAITNELSHVAILGDVAVLSVAGRLLASTDKKDLWKTVPLAVGSLLHLISGITHFLLLQTASESTSIFERALTRAGIKNNIRETANSLLFWPKIMLLVPYYSRSSDIDVTRNIYYTEEHNKELALDVYKKRSLPPSAPVLVYIHGGGWVFGDKAARSIAVWQNLADQGFIVVSINYRLAPKSKMRQIIIDCKRALAWVRQIGCSQFGGNPSQIAIGGESAGGHLALVLALTQNDPIFQPGFESVDTSVIACIDLCACHDLTDVKKAQKDGGGFNHYIMNNIIGEPDKHDKALLDKINPVAILLGTTATSANVPPPPIFSVHGTGDSLVFVEDARLFVDELRRVRSTSSRKQPATEDVYIELPKAPHVFNVFPGPRGVIWSVAVSAFLSHVRTHL